MFSGRILLNYRFWAVTIALVGVVALISIVGPLFIVALTYSKAGEIAGALGGVLGGIIGAAGASLAVYLTLAGQRHEDQQRMHSAIVGEIIEFTNIIIGILELCEKVRVGELEIPKTKLLEFVDTPTPIIYPAISDKIGLLASPQRIVGFYMRVLGVRYTAGIIARSPFSEGQTLGKDDVKVVVEPLAIACQLAKLIIEDADGGAWLDQAISEVMPLRIETALKKTIENFDLEWELL